MIGAFPFIHHRDIRYGLALGSELRPPFSAVWAVVFLILDYEVYYRLRGYKIIGIIEMLKAVDEPDNGFGLHPPYPLFIDLVTVALIAEGAELPFIHFKADDSAVLLNVEDVVWVEHATPCEKAGT